MDLIYLDCFSGVSGDMLLAALIDLGFPLSALQQLIDPLNLAVSLQSDRIVVTGITSSRFRVIDSNPVFRNLSDIEQLFVRVRLPSSLASRALHVIKEIADVEARIHNIPVNDIHFHEIGAADTIIDILGVLYAIQYLRIQSIYCSPLPWSRGFIEMDHGLYPGPAPATAYLLEGIPCQGTDTDMELVTPTGAALIRALQPDFSPLPLSVPVRIGYGAGSRTRNDSVPNILRIIGADYFNYTHLVMESVAVLECEMDDMNPEWLTFISNLLQTNKAVLDFYTTPVSMKKDRSGLLLTVLCHPNSLSQVACLIIQHSSTLGIRYSLQQRFIVDRYTEYMATPWGDVQVKVAILPNGQKRVKPEYDDCQDIAVNHGLSLYQVYQTISGLIACNYPCISD